MTTFTVGNGQQFATITAAVAAAKSGDTIQVQAGTYTNDFPSYINGLTIAGVGGQVNLVATAQPPNGKAILDVGGNTTLKNLTFSGATVADGNGAGVRYEGGNLTVVNCVFHDNQDGLLGNADPSGTITIDSSEFYNNGTSAGNAHNIYIGDIQQFTLTNSYLHDANVGHEVKSRAENNTITGNRILDNSGSSSYSIDLPNGGNATITGNTIEQGPNGQNPTIIAYGEEGGSSTLSGRQHAGTSLTLSNNTVVNDLTAHAPLLLWNAGNAAVTGAGNVLYGVNASQLGSGVPASAVSYASAKPALSTSSPVTTGGATAPTPTPAPAPAPTPAPAPAVAQGGTFGSGADTLTVTLAEDAYQGDAQANVSIDGKLVTATPITVTALHSAAASEAFNFEGNFGTGQHSVAVSFLNDAWGGSPSLDRNLYVGGVTLDGQASPTLASGAVEMYGAGTDTFGVSGGTAAPTPTAATKGDTLVLHLSEDAWQGNAQFIVSLDGHQLGGTQTATASHAAGQVQDFTYQGNFGVGPHDLAITFLNDAWGGTPSTDRNLYVNGASYDGAQVPHATAGLYSNGTVHFQVAAPSTI